MKMKILAVGAHGDDIEIGCGGTLLKKREYCPNLELYMAVMTLNTVDPKNTAVRREEEKKVAKILGAELISGPADFVESRLEFRPVLQLLDGWLEDIGPDEIFVHWENDSHQDHMIVARAVFAATRRLSASVFMYESMTSISFLPTIFVDVTSQMERKAELLSCFASQITEKRMVDGFDLIKRMRATTRYHGVVANMECAEGFIPYRVTKEY